MKIAIKHPQNPMNNPDRIIILSKFRPYLRLLCAYQPDNFRQNDGWRSQLFGVVCAFYATLMIGSMAVVSALMFWNLLESHAHVKVLVVSIPMTISLVEVCLIYVALVWESATAAKMVERIQQLVRLRTKSLC